MVSKRRSARQMDLASLALRATRSHLWDKTDYLDIVGDKSRGVERVTDISW